MTDWLSYLPEPSLSLGLCLAAAFCVACMFAVVYLLERTESDDRQ